MKMTDGKITVSAYKKVSTYAELEAELDIDEFVEALSEEDCGKLMAALAARVPEPGRPTLPTYERLYLALGGNRVNEVMAIARDILYEQSGRIA